MKSHPPTSRPVNPGFPILACGAALVLALVTPGLALASDLVDDFSDAEKTSRGITRLVIDDQSVGGKSQATQDCANGVFTLEGSLAPARGMPAFISVVLLLSPEGSAQDLSAYSGIRLRVKITKGTLSVQAGSTKVDNFDYHTSAPLVRSADEFKEVRIAFKDMKRAWSEQTALDQAAITSINLVAAGLAPGAFAYEVDEVGFY